MRASNLADAKLAWTHYDMPFELKNLPERLSIVAHAVYNAEVMVRRRGDPVKHTLQALRRRRLI